MFWNGFKFTLGACLALGLVSVVVSFPLWYVDCREKIQRYGPPPASSSCAMVAGMIMSGLTEEAKSVQP